MSGKLTTFQRSDGGSQAVINGHPLYTFTLDKAPGQTAGEGLNENGGLWYVVNPAGNQITSLSSWSLTRRSARWSTGVRDRGGYQEGIGLRTGGRRLERKLTRPSAAGRRWAPAVIRYASMGMTAWVRLHGYDSMGTTNRRPSATPGRPGIPGFRIRQS